LEKGKEPIRGIATLLKERWEIMGRGINKIILVGNLGNDPEVKVGQSGNTFATLSVATTDQWKDKQGERQERTEWHRVVLFGRLAEIARDYLHKGSSVYLEGKIQTRKYTDREGNERYITEIVGNQLEMLGGKPSENNSGYTPAEQTRHELPNDAEWLDKVPF